MDKPSKAKELFFAGLGFFEQGRYEDAKSAFKESNLLTPGRVSVLLNLTASQIKLKEFEHCLHNAKLVTEIDPDNTDAWLNLGVVYDALGKHEEGLECVDTALKLNRTLTSAIINRGQILFKIGREVEALESFDEVSRNNPDNTSLHCVIADFFHQIGNHEKAIGWYTRAIDIESEHADSHFGLSLSLLALGLFKKGWEEYRWGWLNGKRKPLKIAPPIKDIMDPEELIGKSILVRGEQGIGDDIMFASAIQDASKICRNISFHCREKLKKLFQRSFPENVLVLSPGDNVDYQSYEGEISIGDLCGLMRQDVQSFGVGTRYLFPDTSSTNLIRAQIKKEQTGGAKKICGVSWKTTAKSASQRSIALLELISELNIHEQFDFVSLQYGDTAEEIRIVNRELGVKFLNVNQVDRFNDIDGLASLISTCDQVVSIDNSVAHLAGALGAPTSLLLPQIPDWRWWQSFVNCNWYATVQCHRLTGDEGWRATIKQVQAKIKSIS